MTVDIYGSSRQFFVKAPAYVVSTEDKERIQSYDLWESIYRNGQGVFKLLQRGQDASPIYLPSPRKCIDAIARFLAVGWDYSISPRVGTTDDQLTVNALLSKLFKRENLRSKFSAQKTFGLIRGDKIWHIIGDGTKDAGSRISVYAVPPSNYFPILIDNDPARISGCHLVDIIVDPADRSKEVARRQTYLKQENGSITSSLKLFEVDAWDDRNLEAKDVKQVGVVTPDFTLPPAIRSIPVYHVKNNHLGLPGFGLGELSGLERVFAAANQAISDEELTLAIQGLGLYVSTAGPPEGESGGEGDWEIGPAKVVELPGPEDSFTRISGVTSVAPMLDHINFILGETTSALGLSDIAMGRVDSAGTAESGISLAIQLSPLLAKNAAKEEEELGISDQMLFDFVHMWFPAYEGLNAAIAVEAVSVVDDPMPKNRTADVAEVLALATSTPPLITVAEARGRLVELGYDLESDGTTGLPTAEGIISEQQRLAVARSYDPFANRFESELDIGSSANAATGA